MQRRSAGLRSLCVLRPCKASALKSRCFSNRSLSFQNENIEKKCITHPKATPGELIMRRTLSCERDVGCEVDRQHGDRGRDRGRDRCTAHRCWDLTCSSRGGPSPATSEERQAPRPPGRHPGRQTRSDAQGKLPGRRPPRGWLPRGVGWMASAGPREPCPQGAGQGLGLRVRGDDPGGG